MKTPFIILALSASLILPAKGLAGNSNVLDLKESITDSEIVFPESFETDTRKLLEGWYMKNYTATDDRYATKSDPGASDETVKARLAALPTVIDMPYNHIVREYIDRYVKKGRPQVAAILGLSNYYMPIFEQALEEAGLPLELKYLPVVESGLDPNAVSRHGATGLWQFMLAPAKGLGLEVSSLVDQRRDPYASSRTAARFLKDLYSTYGDWSLAIAAYNCGPGTVNKALRRAGGDPKSHDFWSIYYFLPQETRGYVPMFIAANYVMNYYADHEISPVLPTKPLVTDTIGISDRLHLRQVSDVLDIPIEELRILNPQYRADIIPGSAERIYNLILPSQQVHAFIMSEESIFSHDRELYARRTQAEPGGMPGEEVGEEPFNPADYVAAADEIVMLEGPSTAADSSAAVAPAAAPAAETSRPAQTSRPDRTPVRQSGKTRTVTHTVAQGETLSQIAETYGTTVEAIRSANSLRRNAVRAGQKLRVETSRPDAQASRTSQPSQKAQNSQLSQNSQNSKNSNSKSASKNKKAAKAEPTTHEVKSGESLIVIAKKYGVSVEELRKANPKVKGDMIRAGDDINVPSKGKAASGSKKKNSKKKKRR